MDRHKDIEVECLASNPPQARIRMPWARWKAMAHHYEASPSSETLRDRFAMAALTGVLSSNNYVASFVARDAFEIADAMLKARELSPETVTKASDLLNKPATD